MLKKVTPDRDAPIIPKATKYQGDERLAVKKLSLFVPRLVIREIIINTIKYAPMNPNKTAGESVMSKYRDAILNQKISRDTAALCNY
jgi:hypothetical protein